MRRGVAAFQGDELLPELDLADNVSLLWRFDGMSRRQARARAEVLLEGVGLEGLGERRIWQCSGGERHRAAVARALARTELSLLVADEPTASLDRRTADDIAARLVDQAARFHAALVLATHDLAVASRCDAVLDLGAADAVEELT